MRFAVDGAVTVDRARAKLCRGIDDDVVPARVVVDGLTVGLASEARGCDDALALVDRLGDVDRGVASRG